MTSCCLIDYGSGNVHSARKALAHAGAQVALSGDPEAIARADRLVLPGVGAFASCMARLRAADGVVEAIGAFVRTGRPFLGVCVGMQLMADEGEEHGPTRGLGLIAGRVARLDTQGLPSPHMGWNDVRARGPRHPVLPKDGDAYFVHSYAYAPDSPSVVAATADYPAAFPAMIAQDALVGTQFHPEKSQGFGLDLLSRFVRWAP